MLGMTNDQMIYLGIAIFIAFVIYKERQALGCPTIPDGTDCNNANGKSLVGSKVNCYEERGVESRQYPGCRFSPNNVLNTLETATRWTDKWVTWRLCTIGGIVAAILIFFFLQGKFASPKELAVGTFVIAGIFYFILNFYIFHMVNYVHDNMRKGIDLMRETI
jgi:hypothetical protein